MPTTQAKRSTGTRLFQKVLPLSLPITFLGHLWWPVGTPAFAPAPPPAAQKLDEPPSSANMTLGYVDGIISAMFTITDDLNKAVKSYVRHVDEDIARYDRGPRAADTDINGGEPDTMQSAIRKAFTARALVSSSGEQPGLVADSKEIQNLILMARRRIDASDAANKWLLVVSAPELNGGDAKQKKIRHAQLLKAREAVEAAAGKALLGLPIIIPGGDSSKESAFEGIFSGRVALPQRKSGDGSSPSLDHSQDKSIEVASAFLPLHWEPGQLTPLISGQGYRMALANLGVKDAKGRYAFYQEEWIQRGGVVLRMGQITGVDSVSGQHVLIKRYPTREMPGRLEEVYTPGSLNETRFAKPPETEPAREEAESILAKLTRSNAELPAARERFRNALGTGLARSDRRLRDKGDGTLDTDLPEEVRMQLYAIRGHLLHATIILEAEKNLREETRAAEKGVDELKRVAAWANRSALEEPTPATPAAEWDRLQSRADDAIYTSRKVIESTLAALPPDLSDRNAKFPELSKNFIVHMVGVRASTAPGMAIWQEIWDLGVPAAGRRRLRQEIDTIVIDPATGDQMRLSHQVKYYPAEHDESLVDAYERLGGPVAPPMEVIVPPSLFHGPELRSGI
jgi:hypothetical protein